MAKRYFKSRLTLQSLAGCKTNGKTKAMLEGGDNPTSSLESFICVCGSHSGYLTAVPGLCTHLVKVCTQFLEPICNRQKLKVDTI